MLVKRIIISFLLVAGVASCNSIMSKLNSGVKEDARKLASAGKYRVLETTTSKQVDTGQGTRESACTCNQTLWLHVQSVSAGTNDWRSLCLSKDHEQLIDYAALRQGDIVSFELSDNMLDMECNGSPSTFLKLKK